MIKFEVRGFQFIAIMIDDCLAVFDPGGHEVFDLATVEQAYEAYWAQETL